MEKESKSEILIIDDDESVQNILSKQLNSLNYSCHTECSGIKGIQMVEDDNYDLVLLDINMPLINGIKVLEKIKNIKSDIMVVMISGINRVESVRTALRKGAYDYLVKPWDFQDLYITIKRALDYGYMLKEKREYQKNLVLKVKERTEKLTNALDEIKKTYNETILALGSALETRDIETQAHSIRVSRFALLFAEELGIDDADQLIEIERGAFLHDIGKIGIPDSILRKPGSLTDDEWSVIRKHPEIGKKMVENIGFLNGAVKVIYSHHEHYDGSGYPERLKGKSIPIGARLFSVADALDAIISDRPYRKALPLSEAKKLILNNAGSQFDPEVVTALYRIKEEKLLEQTQLFK